MLKLTLLPILLTNFVHQLLFIIDSICNENVLSNLACITHTLHTIAVLSMEYVQKLNIYYLYFKRKRLIIVSYIRRVQMVSIPSFHFFNVDSINSRTQLPNQCENVRKLDLSTQTTIYCSNKKN